MMIGLDHLGIHFVISQAATAFVLLPVGYLLQGRFSFAADRSWKNFLRYSAALLTNYPVAIVTLWLLCDLLGIKMAWASPIATVVLFVWNYATSYWAFSFGSRRLKDGKHA
jgi:putative flippase GtrA